MVQTMSENFFDARNRARRHSNDREAAARRRRNVELKLQSPTKEWLETAEDLTELRSTRLFFVDMLTDITWLGEGQDLVTDKLTGYQLAKPQSLNSPDKVAFRAYRTAEPVIPGIWEGAVVEGGGGQICTILV